MNGKKIGFGDSVEVTDEEYIVLMEDKYFMDYEAYQEWQKIMKAKTNPKKKVTK